MLLAVVDQYISLEPKTSQVVVLEPLSAYPVLHVNVLTLPVTLALAETVPKSGALKDGHDLAAQVGAVADH